MQTVSFYLKKTSGATRMTRKTTPTAPPTITAIEFRVNVPVIAIKAGKKKKKKNRGLLKQQHYFKMIQMCFLIEKNDYRFLVVIHSWSNGLKNHTLL